MSTRRFEYNDEKSSKFWEIAVEGASHTVCYGKIGANGQSKTKDFDSEEAAAKDADKLIGQKTKKGYVEVTADAGESGDAGAQLRGLLGSLCQTDADEEVMQALCSALRDFDDETLTFEDDDGDEWEVSYVRGGDVIPHDSTPASFSKIATCVAEMYWDGGGPEVGFALDDDGSSAADGWLFDEIKSEYPEVCEKLEAAGGPIASFLAGQNALFFDPIETLSNGEPGMAFISHEGGGWVVVESMRDLDYGQILLRMLADAVTGSDHIPEIHF